MWLFLFCSHLQIIFIFAGARQGDAGLSTSGGVRAEGLQQARQAEASGSAEPFVNHGQHSLLVGRVFFK
jgi:hypothetical protein